MHFEFTLTGREMPCESAAKIFHSRHSVVQFIYLLTQQIAHAPALFSTARSQKSFDLVQRQT